MDGRDRSTGHCGFSGFWACPLPFLLGPLAACLITALMGARLSGPSDALAEFGAHDPGAWRPGSSVSAVAHGATAADPGKRRSRTGVHRGVSLLLGYPFFPAGLRVSNRPTAYFATMPGGFAEMILFGGEKGRERPGTVAGPCHADPDAGLSDALHHQHLSRHRPERGAEACVPARHSREGSS